MLICLQKCLVCRITTGVLLPRAPSITPPCLPEHQVVFFSNAPKLKIINPMVDLPFKMMDVCWFFVPSSWAENQQSQKIPSPKKAHELQVTPTNSKHCASLRIRRSRVRVHSTGVSGDLCHSSAACPGFASAGSKKYRQKVQQIGKDMVEHSFKITENNPHIITYLWSVFFFALGDVLYNIIQCCRLGQTFLTTPASPKKLSRDQVPKSTTSYRALYPRRFWERAWGAWPCWFRASAPGVCCWPCWFMGSATTANLPKVAGKPRNALTCLNHS